MDKLAHAAEYGVFALLLFRALFWPQYKGLQKAELKKGAFVTLVVSGLYGLTDEIHQIYVPGRAATFPDWLADFVGASIAVALCLYLIYPRQK